MVQMRTERAVCGGQAGIRVAVIIPVGPGHENIVRRAIGSIPRDMECFVVDDTGGALGRSAARNRGMDLAVWADWYFFLDADDVMCCGVSDIDTSTEATFGSVCLNSKVKAKNIYPCGWREVAVHGANGTLSMGFFCRADVARRLRFNEELNAGEDFEFYMRLRSFTKRDYPLARIGYDLPSATGPRGYESLDWVGVCNGIIENAVRKNLDKYDLGGDAVLAKAGNS